MPRALTIFLCRSSHHRSYKCCATPCRESSSRLINSRHDNRCSNAFPQQRRANEKKNKKKEIHLCFVWEIRTRCDDYDEDQRNANVVKRLSPRGRLQRQVFFLRCLAQQHGKIFSSALGWQEKGKQLEDGGMNEIEIDGARPAAREGEAAKRADNLSTGKKRAQGQTLSHKLLMILLMMKTFKSKSSQCNQPLCRIDEQTICDKSDHYSNSIASLLACLIGCLSSDNDRPADLVSERVSERLCD